MKRFVETDRWKKPWYRKLSPELKCYWSWLTDNCDCAGIIEVDIEVAALQVGVKSLPDPCEAFPGKVELIDGKHFVRDFVRFQNGPELNPSNNAHKGILKRLQSIGIESVPEESISPTGGAAEGLTSPPSKGKGNGSSKGKGTEKECIEHAVSIGLPESDGSWFFYSMEACGWTRNNKPLKSWRAHMSAWKNAGHMNSQKSAPSHREAKKAKEYAEENMELPEL
jgi:hypothetical protein